MSNNHDTHTSPSGTPLTGASSAGVTRADAPPAQTFPPPAAGVLWVPSPRATAALAAAMLAIGVVAGAAIGPAPSASFAVGQLAPLLPGLTGARARSGVATVQPAAVTPQPTPSVEEANTGARLRKHVKHSRSVAVSPTPSGEPKTTTPSSTTPTSTPETKATSLPPVTKVWLMELAGSSFGEAATQPSVAPYIDDQAVPAGTLLNGWSALDGSAFASDAALIAGLPPQLLDTIVQPPCSEGAAGAGCAPNTPGALSVADEFLKASLPTITSTAAYRENGLIVVTFASVASATATGLPTGAATATLTSQPPAGVLLISPFARAGVRSSATFTPTAPKQSLEKLLRR
jgi:hypothetical protein